MNIKKRLKALCGKPERKLVELKPELLHLRGVLLRAEQSTDPLNEIIEFFDAVSKWHDREFGDLIGAFQEANYGQYDDVVQDLYTLQRLIVRCGRSEFGYNRTKSGEAVTVDNVFLGGIFGLPTETVAYWNSVRDEPKEDAWKDGAWDSHPGVRGKNSYDVVSEQARQFMQSNARPIIYLVIALIRRGTSAGA